MKPHLGTLTLFFLTSLMGLGCEDRAPAQKPETQTETKLRPSQVSKEVTFEVQNNNLPLLKVQAGLMSRYEVREDSIFAELTGNETQKTVKVDIFDSTGQLSAKVEMEKLTYFEQNLKFIATGKVHVLTQNGKRLQGEHLEWDEATRTLKAKGLVHLISPTEQLQGYDLTTDEGMQNYTFHKLSGQVLVKDLNL